ncbi:carboxypeptidase regulatory-like domain-containing protein [Paraburkholderia domus]|jgi:hypothetical protein|uniref:Carboxypeptidase regulatory-like domain-containing protein n=1 Tax=Paraburkholderia domus TaxID=2793075 RepID=A0A9N8QX06_9BURK|nr:carboxypeptidase regulatory-like domain-containing protein [Paraburkholderia domus]MBK5049056.1 carboxypeptidase regulatory-like domain-containing protein [Burkholderia sp. R-70006]MBK5118287.1 carboxypeptidase regulatory-like domain-containing protein [Burkholderia sp. R-69980]MBK5164126.1 carboxypeptidase regulatory-like domain-containing protein [Burkholderia sp. R-70211]MBK5179838.1 carboxypeptidase regulatory-like domain-containing protein [Burkholderia sp. R-69749]MCI0144374.1 carboxy
MKLLNVAMPRVLQFGSVALATGLLVACGGGGSSSNSTVSGTAAVGAAMANATIQLSCKNGSGGVAANANGAYSATFKFDSPCAITATSGSIAIHSFASGAGNYNVTPLTQLLLSYIAGQLGTSVDALLAGISTNASYQSALTNSTLISNAENGVAQLLSKMYGVTLSTNSFLTASFTPGQPGADADLDALMSAGAIGSDGQPVASLTTAAQAAGAVAAGGAGSTSGSAGPTGGTGGTGGSTTR